MPTWLGIDIGSASVKVGPRTVDVPQAGARAPRVRRGRRGRRRRRGGARGSGPRARAASGRWPTRSRSRSTGRAPRSTACSLPATAQKQLADVLAYELEAQIPFDLEGAVFDWRLLEHDRRGRRSCPSWPRSRASKTCARASSSSRRRPSQEPERVGVGRVRARRRSSRTSPPLAEGETVAVVDLGAKASEVLILERGEPVFARTLSTGTEGLPGHGRPPCARPPRQLRRTSRAGRRSAEPRVPVRRRRVRLGGRGVPLRVARDPGAGSAGAGRSTWPRSAPRRCASCPATRRPSSLALSLAGRGAGMNLRRGPLAFERGFAWVRERIPDPGRSRRRHPRQLRLQRVGAACTRCTRSATPCRPRSGRSPRRCSGPRSTSADEAQDLLSKEAALTRRGPDASRRRLRRHGPAVRGDPVVDEARHRGARRPEGRTSRCAASSARSRTRRRSRRRSRRTSA